MKEQTGVEEMSRDVLFITDMESAERCAAAMAEMLGNQVELASTRRAGLLALRRREFGVVMVEDSLAESDPDWADQIWAETGMAIPLRVHFGVSGASRLTREVRNALMRRDTEQQHVRKAVTAELENELKAPVTGLLLQGELALREAAGSVGLEPKLRSLLQLAGELQQRLRGAHA